MKMFCTNQTETAFFPITLFFSTPLSDFKLRMFEFCKNIANVLHSSEVVIQEAHALGGSLGYAWPMRMQQKTER